MDITAFRTFLAAAETGSFTAAAERVHASTSTVTDRIQQLEHRLGARLFERDKRGCRLTAPGEKFLQPARQAVRAWDVARHEVGLPQSFSRSIAFGGQYILWDTLLGWLGERRQSLPDLAWRVTSGASVRLNRDLAEGFLDMVVLYDPIFRADIAAEPIAQDRLIAVSGGDPENWRDNYVPIEWGEQASTAIASRLELAPETGLVLDLGARSAQWLVEQNMCGFMPERSVASMLGDGRLSRVPGTPEFDYPIYACWRRNAVEVDMDKMVESLRVCFST